MARLKIILYFWLILVLLGVVTQNNVAAEITVNFEQLFGCYTDIVKEAQSGKSDIAIITLNEIIRMDPKALEAQGIPIENAELNKFVALYVRGLIRLYEQGFYNEAIRDFNAAAEWSEIGHDESDPLIAIIRRFRSDAFYMAGDYIKAINDITKSIRLFCKPPDSLIATALPLSELHRKRGEYYSAEGKTQRALSDFMKAIELGSTSDFTFWGYAYELDRSRHNEKARFFFNKANLNAIVSGESKYLGKPISLKTKAFISRRIISASKYITILEDLASGALLYSKAYLSEMRERELTSRIQNLLKALGYDPGNIDGQIGPNTRTAIREFQKDYGIPADGEPTEELYNRLKITIAGMAEPGSRRKGKETPKGGDLSIPKLVQHVIPAIVTVIGYGPDGRPVQMGSGFFVERSLVVTNFHVIDGTRLIKVKTYDGAFHRATVSYGDHSRDLALIKVIDQYASRRQLSISKHPPEIGERIIAIGNPMGLEQTVSDGIISAVRKVNRDLDLIQITAPISPGSSGGPVLNLRGEVIGVSTLFLAKGQSLNFAVSGRHLDGMLRKRK
jgi:tetratricopeptide (TPR) repeat protein